MMRIVKDQINSSSVNETSLIIRNKINQLITDDNFYIKDVNTLFQYYDNIKQDVSRLESLYSHQFITDYTIQKFPDDINIVNQHPYSYVIQNLEDKVESNKLIKNGQFKN